MFFHFSSFQWAVCHLSRSRWIENLSVPGHFSYSSLLVGYECWFVSKNWLQKANSTKGLILNFLNMFFSFKWRQNVFEKRLMSNTGLFCMNFPHKSRTCGEADKFWWTLGQHYYIWAILKMCSLEQVWTSCCLFPLKKRKFRVVVTGVYLQHHVTCA